MLNVAIKGGYLSLYDVIKESSKSRRAHTRKQSEGMKFQSLMLRNPKAEEESLHEKVKTRFYKSGKDLKAIYAEVKNRDEEVDIDALQQLVEKYTQQRPIQSQMTNLFEEISKGRKKIKESDFIEFFRYIVPTGVDVIVQLKNWVFKSGLSIRQAYDRIHDFTNAKLIGIDKEQFYYGVRSLLKLRVEEIDVLFTAVDLKKDGVVDWEEWQQVLGEEGKGVTDNPMENLRMVVKKYKISADDLMFTMKLRVWDPPLNYTDFKAAFLRLDPTLTETDLHRMAKELKNDQDKIEIGTIMRNLTGEYFETVDYNKKVTSLLYKHCQEVGEEKLKRAFEEQDKLKSGAIDQVRFRRALESVGFPLDEEDMERYSRMVDKNTQGLVDYMRFIERMNSKTNPRHNPFLEVMSNLKVFMA
jgi:Ca2+-binding EF-hand superfamily protein